MLPPTVHTVRVGRGESLPESRGWCAEVQGHAECVANCHRPRRHGQAGCLRYAFTPCAIQQTMLELQMLVQSCFVEPKQTTCHSVHMRSCTVTICSPCWPSERRYLFNFQFLADFHDTLDPNISSHPPASEAFSKLPSCLSSPDSFTVGVVTVIICPSASRMVSLHVAGQPFTWFLSLKATV